MSERERVKVIAFVPAKGSSTRVESKNTKEMNGKPLFAHTVEKLASWDFIDEVYLDTEAEAVFELADAHVRGAWNRLERDPVLATNATDGNRFFMNEVMTCPKEADIYVQLLCTSPFVSREIVKKGIDLLASSDKYDSAVLVRKDHLYTWSKPDGAADDDESADYTPDYDPDNVPNSFTLPWTVMETMGLYIIKREAALKHKRRFGEKPFLLEASPLDALDINYPDDFHLCNIVAAGMEKLGLVNGDS